MKVIERKPWSFGFTCRGCQSKLEAEPADVRVGQFGSMGDYETEYYVDCTECGTTQKIPYNKLTPTVQEMAHRASKTR